MKNWRLLSPLEPSRRSVLGERGEGGETNGADLDGEVVDGGGGRRGGHAGAREKRRRGGVACRRSRERKRRSCGCGPRRGVNRPGDLYRAGPPPTGGWGLDWMTDAVAIECERAAACDPRGIAGRARRRRGLPRPRPGARRVWTESWRAGQPSRLRLRLRLLGAGAGERELKRRPPWMSE